ncbi:MAG TPA: DUF2059 domain-containing protein, partial [Burkholderiaceae bacterium]|nr:DUF2059 domain-containing protein [Burkholderiaceae bacterium]
TKKSIALRDEQLNLDHLKSIYIQVYSEYFSQEEIDQLIAFYESPTGIMCITKIPLATQQSVLLMQQKIGPMLQTM